MARYDPFTYRLRRFRAAMLVAVVLPWVLDLLLAPFVGWYPSASKTAILLVLDGLLAFFAWRRPAGIATILIALRLCLGAAVFLGSDNGVGVVYGAVLGAAAVLLIMLLVPIWRPLRTERRHAQLARLDGETSQPDSRAMKRRAKIEERGYL